MPSDYYRVYVSLWTKFGVDISSLFPLECGQTDRQTRLNVLLTPAAIQPVWVIIYLKADQFNMTETRECVIKYVVHTYQPYMYTVDADANVDSVSVSCIPLRSDSWCSSQSWRRVHSNG